LLKTLEEPPPHVVFVLATTDPQKVSDTIRSRTQHLQFHLLPMDIMEDHIRWLAGDAGIDLTDDALQSVLRQGGGSARDTVSALELVASGGGEPLEITPLDEFVEAFIEHDPGRALTVVALAVQQGRDPRTLTDDIVRHLRDCFLSLMAPELVQLPTQRAAEVADLAHRLGAANAVRAMERLGEMLVEMRHAPDPRLLLEVALVQLTHQAASNDVSALLDRLDKLEQQVASGVAATPVARSAPVDPATGRAALGGRARPPAANPVPAATAPPPTAPPAPAASAVEPAIESTVESAPPAAAAAPPPAVAPSAPSPAAPTSAAPTPVAPTSSGNLVADATARWAAEIKPKLKGLARALYSNTTVLGERDGSFALGVANDATRQKCDDHRADVEAAIAAVVGGKVSVQLVIHTGAGDHDDEVDAGNNVVPLARAAAPAPPPPADEDVDLDDLVDAPPESVVSPLDRLAQAFPGSQLVDE